MRCRRQKGGAGHPQCACSCTDRSAQQQWPRLQAAARQAAGTLTLDCRYQRAGVAVCPGNGHNGKGSRTAPVPCSQLCESFSTATVALVQGNCRANARNTHPGLWLRCVRHRSLPRRQRLWQTGRAEHLQPARSSQGRSAQHQWLRCKADTGQACRTRTLVSVDMVHAALLGRQEPPTPAYSHGGPKWQPAVPAVLQIIGDSD
jgi:hypothetical protein